MAKLTFVLEDGQEVVVPLTEHLTVGRAEDNDVVVDDERLSAHHAELVQNADGSLQVFDRKSTAGTFVNDVRIVSHTLAQGDRLAFGPLVATLDLEAAAPAPTKTPRSRRQQHTPAKTTPPTPAADVASLAAEKARLEAEVARLQAQADAAAKELRDWEKRAEKDRALQSARVEALRAEEERLGPVQAAVQEALEAHQQWLDAIHTLTDQHAEKTTALELLNRQHLAKSTEVQRLITTTAELQTQTQQASDRLKQTRDECEQDETLLKSLRQQIIELETRLKEGQAQIQKQQEQVKATDHHRQEQEQEQRLQELASAEKKLAQQLAADTERLSAIQAERAVLEKQCLALSGTQQQLAADTERLSVIQAERAVLEKQCLALAGTQQQLAANTERLNAIQAERAVLEKQCLELADTQNQLADTRKRLTAVEQRYRAVQEDHHQGGSHADAAPSGRPPTGTLAQTPRKTAAVPVAAPRELEELSGQLGTARAELATLQAELATLRAQASSPPVVPTADATAPGIPAPLIVLVDTLCLKPVPMKSEGTHIQGAAPAAAKGKGKKGK